MRSESAVKVQLSVRGKTDEAAPSQSQSYSGSQSHCKMKMSTQVFSSLSLSLVLLIVAFVRVAGNFFCCLFLLSFVQQLSS